MGVEDPLQPHITRSCQGQYLKQIGKCPTSVGRVSDNTTRKPNIQNKLQRREFLLNDLNLWTWSPGKSDTGTLRQVRESSDMTPTIIGTHGDLTKRSRRDCVIVFDLPSFVVSKEGSVSTPTFMF